MLDRSPEPTKPVREPMAGLNYAMLCALVTFLTGISYLTETFSSPAALQPFALLDFLPGHDGQMWWAWLYLLGGVLLATTGRFPHGVHLPWLVRVVVCIAGAGIWGIFGSSSFYASQIGPDASHVGSAGAIFCLTMVICCVAAGTDAARLQ